ncbi:amidohydrolase [Gordonia liuliyuniae]|uniref:Amidohydrolase n=1 Tax=Gordonia liuliyuniae TaxID=2911517 RepID=A0ABS9ISR9_9ACTN|nr:amidohydrolase [Gordonia liuliyuniae]MCF8588602.1 amidohydrolase [Gordonia liuliyuniae]
MTFAASLPQELISRVDAAVDADTDRLVETFKDIHRNPELAFGEVQTSRLIEKALQNLGFDVTKGIGRTGIAATLRNGDGPVVMYRADMDANAIEEQTGLDYASDVRVAREDGSVVPAAHMCGHDAHVTWLIGMANALVTVRDSWSGTAVLIGQPAEEPITGAKAMVDDGLYNFIPKPDVLIGMHTMPAPVGIVSSSPGPRLAGTDQVDIVFHGVGGHGSMPERTKDPLQMAARAVVAFSSVVPEHVDPSQTAILTVGAIAAGADNNVIPSQAVIRTNIRWYDPRVRETLLDAIESVSQQIARDAGAGDDLLPEIIVKGGSLPLVNDPELAASMSTSLAAIIGDDSVLTDLPAATASEDVQILKGPYPDMPFNYLMVGTADPELVAAARARGDEVPFSPHTPNYIVDLAAVPYGTKIAAYAMLGLLRGQ